MSKSAERALAESSIHARHTPNPCNAPAAPSQTSHQSTRAPSNPVPIAQSASDFGKHGSQSSPTGDEWVTGLPDMPDGMNSAPATWKPQVQKKPFMGLYPASLSIAPVRPGTRGGPADAMEDLAGDPDMRMHGGERDAGDEDGLWDDLRGLEAGPAAVRFTKRPATVAHAMPNAVHMGPSNGLGIQQPPATQRPPATASRAAAAYPASYGAAGWLTQNQAPEQNGVLHDPKPNVRAHSQLATPIPAKGEAHAAAAGPFAGKAGALVGTMICEGDRAEASPPAAAAASSTDGEAMGSASHSIAAGLQRVIMHCDVDCFYCQVERLDDSSLKGIPLAVQQFNSGGFVAVSYEVHLLSCLDRLCNFGPFSILF